MFVLIVSALAPTSPEMLSQSNLIITGVALAFIPAILWLSLFYVQDRSEPEPKSYVFGVFILGALLAKSVGQPLITDFFQVGDWVSRSLGLKVAAGILIVGVIQEFLKYAAIRYSIFNSEEFDERIDGIIYGAVWFRLCHHD